LEGIGDCALPLVGTAFMMKIEIQSNDWFDKEEVEREW
jgi:hypothetical protein